MAMENELRTTVRQEYCGELTLLLKNGAAVLSSRPLYLKDISEGGFCAGYLGVLDDLMKYKLLLKGPGRTLYPVNLVWFSKSVELVYLIGFKFPKKVIIQPLVQAFCNQLPTI
jgi:hypothetical protein